MTTNVSNAVRSALESAVKTFNKVAAEQSKLNEKRTGSYSGTLDAAILAGNVTDFLTAYNSLVADINADTGKIGKRLGCSLSKPDKTGAVHYVVPGGLMSAVSVIKAAMQYGISLTDKDGTARSFTEIRKEKVAADAAAAESTMTPLQSAQNEVRKLAMRIAAGADALTFSQARECLAILEEVMATETGESGDTDESSREEAA